jgi:DNA-directed RNA polymerase subunit omega
MSIVEPRLNQLLEQVNSNYALVNAAAKRARQINTYRYAGGGVFSEEMPPMASASSEHELSIALEEIAQGKIRVVEGRRSAPRKSSPSD